MAITLRVSSREVKNRVREYTERVNVYISALGKTTNSYKNFIFSIIIYFDIHVKISCQRICGLIFNFVFKRSN